MGDVRLALLQSPAPAKNPGNVAGVEYAPTAERVVFQRVWQGDLGVKLSPSFTSNFGRLMTAPMPAPGWYPDPSGTNTQRYFDGQRWTEHLAPSPDARGPIVSPAATNGIPAPRRKTLRPFVILLVAGLAVAVVSFVAMQLAFGAASDGDAPVAEVLGFVAFGIWAAGVVAFLVGVIGAVVRAARNRQ